jgi:SAM-dependent methyltransferase
MNWVYMFWDEFYKGVAVTDIPSSFANFCERFVTPIGNNFLLDVGCGNARDTHHFYELGLDATGIDNCQVVVDLNKQKYENLEFHVCSADNLEQLDLTRAPKYIYSRFFLHAINKLTASAFLTWATKVIADEGYFFIECRSDKDPMFGIGTKISDDEYINGHYRRFINLSALIDELDSLGWSVIYCSESSDLSVVNNDNPVLIRLIVKKSAFRVPKPNLYLLKIKPDVVLFIETMNKSGTQVFATCGTLLGSIRCEGITPWDTDVDIGVLYPDFLQMLDVLKGQDYYISSDGVDEAGARKRYRIESRELASKFDFDKELIWLHDEADTYYIQINIFDISDTIKPPFWADFHSDRFLVHLSRELRDGYEEGRYNLPYSLFYPLITHPFYDSTLLVHEKSEQILKRWYGKTCLTNYPRSSASSLDLGRFETADARIEYLYGI